MGLLKKIFRNLHEAVSPIEKLNGKFQALNYSLIGYTIKKHSTYSPQSELDKTNSFKIYSEILEMSTGCLASDRITFHFLQYPLEVSVSTAVKAAEYWLDSVYNKEQIFTEKLVTLLVNKAEYDLKNLGYSTNMTLTKLGSLLPNFVEFMAQLSNVISDISLIRNDALTIEYTSPILTYGKVMGYNHYVIELFEAKYNMQIFTIGKNGEEIMSEKRMFTTDLSVEKYSEFFSELSMQMMSDPRYLKIAIIGF